MNLAKSLTVAVLTGVALTALAADKKIEPAPADKAVVYIGKMNAFVGGAAPIHFFANDRYLARVKGKKYVRLEVEPGDHLFWVASQARRTFVKAKLEAGRSYALYAKLGGDLLPITRESDDWGEFGSMLRGEKPYQYDEKDIEEWRQRQPRYIEQALAEWKAAGEPALRLMPDEHID